MSRTKSKINDLEINLSHAERARKNGTIPATWELGKHTLEFLQRMKVIKYRESREFNSKLKKFIEVEKEFLQLLQKEVSPKIEHLKVTHIIGDNPFKYIGAWPMIEGRVMEEEKYLSFLEQGKFRERYQNYIELIEEQEKIIIPLRKWLYEKFKSKNLEKEIQSYLFRKNSSPKKSLFPKIMLNKMSGKRDRPEEVLPTFDTSEIDVLHVAWWKSQNMTEKELQILKRLDPEANRETDSQFKVVIERSEALNMCYVGGARNNERRLKFFTTTEALTRKSVTWVLPKEDGGYILYQEPVLRTAFAYELSQEGLEEGRYFCVEIPRKLLNKVEEGPYFKTHRNERLDLRSAPPKMSAIQDKFVLQLKGIAPINKKSKRCFKWDAQRWIEKLWGEDKHNFSRNLDTLEEFGKKQVLLHFLETFERIEEGGKTFISFSFPEYCKYN